MLFTGNSSKYKWRLILFRSAVMYQFRYSTDLSHDLKPTWPEFLLPKYLKRSINNKLKYDPNCLFPVGNTFQAYNGVNYNDVFFYNSISIFRDKNCSKSLVGIVTSRPIYVNVHYVGIDGIDIVRDSYNTVSFLSTPFNRHPIVCLWVQSMKCLESFESIIQFLL